MTEIKQLQLRFWTAFSDVLQASSFVAHKPAAKNWYYLYTGTSRAKIVLTINVTDGLIGCKLDVKPKGAAPDQVDTICKCLTQDSAAIEAELGFADLEWGDPTGTRIYRYARADVRDEVAWTEAHAWLLSNAEKFKEIFRPRVEQIELPARPTTPGPPATTAPSSRASGQHRAPRSITDKRVRDRADAEKARKLSEVTTGGLRRRGDQNQTVTRSSARFGNLHEFARCRDRGLAISAAFRTLADECDLKICPHVENGNATLALYSNEQPDAIHRYAFAEWWGEQSLNTTVAWVLLNPSIGDADGHRRPVLDTCRTRSRSWGATALVIVNLFAYRTRYPKELKARPIDVAVGPHNDRVLQGITGACRLTVAAWGNDPAKWNRSAAVRPWLKNAHCLRKRGQNLTDRRQPFHPSRGVSAELIPLT